jgi:hypothetical protein
MKRIYTTFAVVMIVVGLSGQAKIETAQDSSDALEQGFKKPPEAAKPRTWWHWTGGNVTKEGITKDLEWMKRIGIAGMQLADVSFGMGQSVDQKIMFGSPEWLDAVRYAAAEADRLGLEMAIFSSAGWSLTGGPWVKPEQAMKKLVWSVTNVDGPMIFSGQLPQPPTNNGPFQNLSTGGSRRNNTTQPPDPTFYKDSAVIAYPTPADEAALAEPPPKVTSNEGKIDATALLDDDLNTTMTIRPTGNSGTAWLQLEFAQPFPAQAITLAGPRGIPVGRVLASEDGTYFHTIVALPGAQLYRQGRIRTFAFLEIDAKFYRVELDGAPLGPAETMSQAPPQPAQEYVLSELKLHYEPRVHRWEEKAGFSFLFEYESVPTPKVPAELTVRRSDIIDLTSKMNHDGILNWDVPTGKWTILRLGYSLTGAKNRPAVPSGLGYEVDKLSSKYTESYLHGYLDAIATALGPLYGKSLRYVLLDSWEAGMQNWTDEMVSEFQKRRGYNPLPYLPVLTGRVVESADVSDRFLWDFRRTLADMFAENYYGTIQKFLHQQGLEDYGEASGVSLEILEDALLNKKYVDIPMGEFWVRDLHPSAMYYQDVRGAASAAHVYGKNIVAAESFTGGGYEAPYTLKKVADYWFAQGVNRIVIHTSAHQPLDTKPGNTMVGTHMNRNITWAELAKPFMTYLARNSFMLQQGQFVADIAYLLNEGAPSTMPFWGAGLQPVPPEGYDYDYINTDVLLNRMSVDTNGCLLLPNGMSYRMLALPRTDRMSVPMLRKIHQLVQEGATIVGPRPRKSPSLAGYPQADRDVKMLAEDLWGDLDGISRTKRFYGKGTVVWGLPLSEILESSGITKDVEHSRALDTKISWIHRRNGNTDIYFVANNTDDRQDIDARFRVSGKAAEIWYPDTGAIEPSEFSIGDSVTTVPLHLAEREAVFVVFRRAASAASYEPPSTKRTVLATVTGSWQVRFPPALGAPDKIQLEELASWTTSADSGVKYFSGTATYKKSIEAEKAWFGNRTKILLNLGVVKDLAEVSLNGQALGILWKAPYELDITNVVKPGANQLEIKVTNQWTNRLIGDQLVSAGRKVLTAGGRMRFFGGTPPLAESGLIGPVTVVAQESD